MLEEREQPGTARRFVSKGPARIGTGDKADAFGKRLAGVAMGCLALLAFTETSQGGWQAWTTTDARHVLRGEPAGVETTVDLAGARNEWVSFQILTRSDVSVTGVNVVPGDLVGPGGVILKADQARLFRQHQLELKIGTVGNADFKPDWYPDPLIPFPAPAVGKAILRALLPPTVSQPQDTPSKTSSNKGVRAALSVRPRSSSPGGLGQKSTPSKTSWDKGVRAALSVRLRSSAPGGLGQTGTGSRAAVTSGGGPKATNSGARDRAPSYSLASTTGTLPGSPIAKLGASQGLQAVPFNLPAAQTHGFWVDLYVPPGTKAGLYRGTYTVTAAGRNPLKIPVTLTVWDFDLPAVPTLQTAFGSPGVRLRRYYSQRVPTNQRPTNWSTVDAQCAGLLADHRVSATPPEDLITPVLQSNGTYRIPPTKLAALATFIDTYHVNAIEIPSLTVVVKDPEAQRAKLQAWLDGYTAAAAALNRSRLTFYVYLADEPNDAAAYARIRTWGRVIRGAKSAVKVMITEQDTPQNAAWGDLHDATDIWCPAFWSFQPNTAPGRQGLGETFWSYTAINHYECPTWHIDDPLLNYRVPAWIAWRYRIRGLLYWGDMTYWQDVNDPWTDPKTYRYQGSNTTYVYNGEGTLVYPGLALGYHGIAASIRLKALRDGVQDYEYMAILERLGKADAAQKIVEPLASSWRQWNRDPAAYKAARAKLAQLIVADSFAPPLASAARKP
ncbi:MAG: glycoside hydrolase domain-containing protein [Planctomycetota bacterium]